MLRTNTCGELTEKDIGKTVKLCGWADTIREHGKIIFVDLRDRYGKTQCVVFGKNKEAFEAVKGLTKESSLMIEGKVGQRPKGTENKDMVTGMVEVAIDKVEVFNKCPVLPFEIGDKSVSEEIRLRHRFLDLRSDGMQRNILMRSKVIRTIRDYMGSKNFNEIETPMLVKYTPGGARNYLVPSRFEAGKFWALPESPQLFKQLLMVAGFDRYFQIARCLRDEDLRKDRQPEFTQLDVEMSFATQEDIIELMEGLFKKLWKEVLNVEIKTPFPRMTYDEAMKKYGNDRPDMRKDKNNPKEYAFLWVVDFPLFQYSEEDQKYVANHHPFTSPNMEDFEKNPYKSRSHAYDLVLNGVEVGGGSIRIHNQELQQKIFEAMQIGKEEQDKKFKFLLDALQFGAPPHGGIAIGLDRLMQLMLETESIREAIAFPKNTEGKEVMLGAPAEVSDAQLKELHISVVQDKEKKDSKDKAKAVKKTKKKK